MIFCLKNYDFFKIFLQRRSISHNLKNPLLKYEQITLEHAMHRVVRAGKLLVRIFKRFYRAHHLLLVCPVLSNFHCQKLRRSTLYGAPLYIKFHDLV